MIVRALRVLAFVVVVAGGLLQPACTIHKSTFVAEDPSGKQGRPVRVEYEGADTVARIELSRAIEDLMLDLSRDPEREGAAFDAALQIQEFYQEQGYPDVKVDYKVRPTNPEDERSEIVVTFRIQEGPRVVVDSLEIEGNTAIPDDELKQLWLHRASGVLGLGDPLFYLAGLESFATSIVAYYNNRGYLEASTQPLVIERPEPARARVVVRVEEGPLFELREATLGPKVTKALGARAPKPPAAGTFSAAKIEEWRLSVRARLRDLGYPDPKLETLVGRVRDTTAVDARIEGEPGVPVRVAEIVVRGNEYTREWVLRNKLELEPGDLFSGTKEDTALRKIYLTGLFRKARIVHEEIEGRSDEIRLVIEVEEMPSRTLDFKPGYGTYERFRMGVRFTERNVFGTARDFTAEGLIHSRGYKTGAQITDPDLFGTETIFTVGGEFYRRRQPSYVDKVLGGTTSLQRHLVGPLSGRVGYTFENRDGSRVEAADPTASNANFNQGFVFAELAYDTRNFPLFTTSGHHEVLSVDVADDALGGDVSYMRLRARSTVYFPVSDPVQIVLHGDTGVVWATEGANLPLQERFFNGGESSVRSFKEDQLGPKDARGEPLGGEFRNIFNVEARWMVLSPVQLIAFADAGNVGRRIGNYGTSDLRYALGAGVSYGLPIGPLRLDAAFNPDRRSGEEEWVIHLTIGHPF